MATHHNYRPLPEHVNLESERKRAKRLYRAVVANDREAIDRVKAAHDRFRQVAEGSAPSAWFSLTDAQFVIAREYGFASWPRFKKYCEHLVSDCAATRHLFQLYSLDSLRDSAHGIARELAAGSDHTIREIQRYVPRFSDKPLTEIVRSELTLEEAQLVVARRHGMPTWAALEERVRNVETRRASDLQRRLDAAFRAMRDSDLIGLQQQLDDTPELVSAVSYPEEGPGAALLEAALRHRYPTFDPIDEQIVQLFIDRGANMDHALTRLALRAPLVRDVGWVDHLFTLGARFPGIENGASAVEVALTWWNTEVATYLAERTTYPRSLWIDAGLGRESQVDAWFLPDGAMRIDLNESRPRHIPGGMVMIPPENDQATLMAEAFLVAVMNQQFGVADMLIARGVDVDTRPWGDQTVLHVAIGNAWEPVVRYLLDRGAARDLIGKRPALTQSQLAVEMAQENPNDTMRQIIRDLVLRSG